MLVLSRYVGEEIVIGGNIHVQVLGFHGRKVRLGITAPGSVSVDRTEISERRLKYPDGPPPSPASIPEILLNSASAIAVAVDG